MNLLLFNLRVDRDDTALGFTTDWINELAKHFDHVTVITMFSGTLAVASNVEVISAGLEKGLSKPRRVFEFYWGLWRALRSRHHDVCFAHMMPLFLVLASPLLSFRRIPACLWYAHNHKSLLLPIATAIACKVLTSTPTAFPLETPKLRVIGQGIDTDRFRPLANERDKTIRLMTVGRITPVKNIDLMIRAFARLRDQRPGLHAEFLIIGEPLSARDTEYLNECQTLSNSLGLETVVSWMPPVPFHSVHEAYQQGDIFLSACSSGLDKTILEAMASGLSVVAMHRAVAEPLGAYLARDEGTFGESLVSLCDLAGGDRAALGLRLRNFVVRDHSLVRLGRRISDELMEMTA